MKSTLIFLSVLTGVALAQLHHCTKYSDCSHLKCDYLYGYHCKDNVCVCEPWCAYHTDCPCPLGGGFTGECWYGGCSCRDSNGLYTGKHCVQKSDCNSITCHHNETRHCKDAECACQRL